MELVGSVVKKNIDEFCLYQFYVNENNVMNTKYINPIKKINLHLHTSVSDGALAPRALIERSRAIGLDLISITDHDTTDAYRLIGEADLGLRLLPGIEISSQHEGNDVHILAYGYDIDAPGLNELTEMYLIGRRDRAVKMLDKLSKLGMDIALDEVVAVAGSRELIVRLT
jgi:predicted metal-dependent phosphoesterase TrpH